MFISWARRKRAALSATRDAAGTQARGVRERQALAVMGVECLNFKRGAVGL